MDMKIPELTQHQRDLLAMGLCPFCEAPIQGWDEPKRPSFLMAYMASGRDPKTGHRTNCPHPEITIR